MSFNWDFSGLADLGANAMGGFGSSMVDMGAMAGSGIPAAGGFDISSMMSKMLDPGFLDRAADLPIDPYQLMAKMPPMGGTSPMVASGFGASPFDSLTQGSLPNHPATAGGTVTPALSPAASELGAFETVGDTSLTPGTLPPANNPAVAGGPVTSAKPKEPMDWTKIAAAVKVNDLLNRPPLPLPDPGSVGGSGGRAAQFKPYLPIREETRKTTIPSIGSLLIGR